MNGPTLFVFVGGGSYIYEDLNSKFLFNNDIYIHIVDPMIENVDPDIEEEPVNKKLEYLETLIPDNIRFEFINLTYADYTKTFQMMMKYYEDDNIFFSKIFIMIFASEAYNGAIQINNGNNEIYLIDLTRSVTDCIYMDNEFINFISLSYEENFANFLSVYNSVANIYNKWTEQNLYEYQPNNRITKQFCIKYHEILTEYRTYLDWYYKYINVEIVKCLKDIENEKYNEMSQFFNRNRC